MNELLKDLCRSFCGDLSINELKIGYSIKTPFRDSEGDAIPVYIRRNSKIPGLFRLEDSGETIFNLQQLGVSLDNEIRKEEFNKLLIECGCEFDEDDYLIHTEYVDESSLAPKFLKFMSFLLRVEDLRLLSREKVRDTFKADVELLLMETFGNADSIEAQVAPTADLKDYVADFIVTINSQKLAVYSGNSEVSALEAFALWHELTKHKITNITPFIVLPKSKPENIKGRTYSRIINSGVGIASMDGPRVDAMNKMRSMLEYRSIN